MVSPTLTGKFPLPLILTEIQRSLYLDMVLGCCLYSPGEVRVDAAPVRVQVTENIILVTGNYIGTFVESILGPHQLHRRKGSNFDNFVHHKI